MTIRGTGFTALRVGSSQQAQSDLVAVDGGIVYEPAVDTVILGASAGDATTINPVVAVWTDVSAGADSGQLNGRAGYVQHIYNADGLDSISIFPPTGGTIDGGAIDAAITVAAGEKRTIVQHSALNSFTILSA